MKYKHFEELNRVVIECQRCPRLIAYCMQVAENKRRAYQNQTYWGKPVPGFGDHSAKIVIIGLAPGAHGSNRTGRMFTGDRSGDFLYDALYRAGLCNQPVAISKVDGLKLHGVYITAVGRCAPPGNKPLRRELENCRSFLQAELELLTHVKVALALGKIAFEGLLDAYLEEQSNPKNRLVFKHGAVNDLGKYTLVSSYHVSQQNTQTGRLTTSMFDEILETCQQLC